MTERISDHWINKRLLSENGRFGRHDGEDCGSMSKFVTAFSSSINMNPE